MKTFPAFPLISSFLIALLFSCGGGGSSGGQDSENSLDPGQEGNGGDGGDDNSQASDLSAEISGLTQLAGNVTLDLAIEGRGTVTLKASLGGFSEIIEISTEGNTSHSFRIPRQGDPLSVRTMTLEAFNEQGALLAMREYSAIEPLDLPDHALLAMTQSDQATLKSRYSVRGRARFILNRMLQEVETYLDDELSIPGEKGGDPRGYRCLDHGDFLKVLPNDENSHMCPVDGHVYSPTNTDPELYAFIQGAYNSGRHKRLAQQAFYMGVAYQLSGDMRYADRVADILTQYADVYMGYPVNDRYGDEDGKGSARVLTQSLDESRWLVALSRGLDLIRGSGVLSEAEKQTVLDDLIRPSCELLANKRATHGINNHQCWHNTAVFLAAMQIEDFKIARESIFAESGMMDQLSRGNPGEGIWTEGSFGYHYFALRAILPMLQGMRRAGIVVDENEVRKLFLAPISIIQPDGTLPMINDGFLQNFSTNLPDLYEQAVALFNDVDIAAPLDAFGRGKTVESVVYGLNSIKSGGWKDPTSTNLSTSGMATLRSETSEGKTLAILDYGPHGGVHGHRDKFGLSVWMGDDLVLRESGHIGYSDPWYHGWYKRTLAHSTLLRDGLDQKVLLQAATSQSFEVDAEATTLLVESDSVYPGSTLQRLVHTTPNGRFMDIFGVSESESHVWDYVLHGEGTASINVPLKSISNVGFGGTYNFLKNAKGGYANGDIIVTFTNKSGKSHTLRVFGEAGTTVILADAPGFPSNKRHPVLIIRREGPNPVFASVVTEGDDLPFGMTATIDTVARALTFQEPEADDPVTLSLQ